MGRRATGTVEPLKTSIRLKFTWQEKRCVETLKVAPTAANLKGAHATLKRVQAAIATGTYDRRDYFDTPGEERADSFRDVADLWLKSKTGAKSTLANYGWSVGFWKAALPDVAISKIKYSDITGAIKDKAETVSGKTLNNHLIVIRGIFKFAKRDKIITDDPTAEIEQQKHQSPPPDPFSTEERDAMLKHMKAAFPDAILNYFQFAFFTGLRPSELIAVRWGDVDWKKKTIRVQRARVMWEDKGTKTNTVRDVRLTPPALDALTRQKTHTFMKGAECPIFCNPLSGNPWADDQRQRRAYFQPALRTLGIRARDAYNTRHTFATAALMAGVNPARISKQLGHANTGMLFKHYGTWIEGADQGAEDAKLDAAMSESSIYCPRKDAK